MLRIEFPAPSFSFRLQDGREFIFDGVRKKWVRLTPEEWVRQNIVQFLVTEKHYAATLLAIEKQVVLGDLKKRCDIVVFKDAKPWMIIECKEPGVPLSEAVMMQVLRYNISNDCAYVVISNGTDHKGWHLSEGIATEITELPPW